MDLIELARTIQADRDRVIAAAIRRRQLTATAEVAPQLAPAARTSNVPQRPASSGVLSR